VRPGRRWLWPLFAASALVILGLLGFMYAAVQEEESHQKRVREALQRANSIWTTMLSREAERPHNHYAPFEYVQQEVFTRGLQKIQKDEILAQSPLLEEKPDFVRLHFKLDSQGRFSSPQVPESNFLEIAGNLAPEAIDANRVALGRIRSIVDPVTFGLQLREAEQQTAQQGQWVQEMKKRAPRGEPVTVGTFEGFWVQDELFFARRASAGREVGYHCFWVDWPRLRVTLLEGVRDLLPAASLEPDRNGGAGLRLAALPVLLEAPQPLGAFGRWATSSTALLVTLACTLLAILLTGIALKTLRAFGEQQRQFASLVTHELRSPLTTFRLYSDLLAEGLMTDPQKRHAYHRTLQKESDQMARMVENVIALSRLEAGRAKLRPERILLGPLVESHRADLERCAQAADLSLDIDLGGLQDVALQADSEAVGQILFNLVENACKYGKTDIFLGASTRGGTLRLRVRDKGPGVPPAQARRVFAPYRRDESAPVRGLGLGLALSRGLARDLGGELTLESPTDGGACFVLSLPVAS
jgi:signal transduction histidine kinase